MPQENQFLLGLGVSFVAIAAVSAGMMLAMRRSFVQQAQLQEQPGSELPPGLTPARTPQEKVSGCYLNKGGPELEALLRATRPGRFCSLCEGDGARLKLEEVGCVCDCGGVAEPSVTDRLRVLCCQCCCCCCRPAGGGWSEAERLSRCSCSAEKCDRRVRIVTVSV